MLSCRIKGQKKSNCSGLLQKNIDFVSANVIEEPIGGPLDHVDNMLSLVKLEQMVTVTANYII